MRSLRYRGRALSGCEPLWLLRTDSREAGVAADLDPARRAGWALPVGPVPSAPIQAAAGQCLCPGGEACTEQRVLLSGWSAETWTLTNCLGSVALGIGYFISNRKNYMR